MLSPLWSLSSHCPNKLVTAYSGDIPGLGTWKQVEDCMYVCVLPNKKKGEATTHWRTLAKLQRVVLPLQVKYWGFWGISWIHAVVCEWIFLTMSNIIIDGAQKVLQQLHKEHICLSFEVQHRAEKASSVRKHKASSAPHLTKPFIDWLHFWNHW